MQKLITISALLFCLINISFAQNASLAIPKTTLDLGEKIFLNTCANCHNSTSTLKTNGPNIALLTGMSPRAIHSALSNGKMQAQGLALSDEERKAVAQWITKRPLVEYTMPKEAFTTFSLPPKAAYNSGWGGNLEGTGFNTQSNINASNVASLKIKWVFAFPDATQVRSKPAVVGDWLIVGSQFGDVYALDQKMGKIGWHFKGSAAIRGAIAIAPTAKGLGVYFADYATNVYALDLATGKLIWQARAGEHPYSAVTGSVAVYQNKVIVPLTSFEVISAQDPNFPCCSSSGEVVALNAENGSFIWRHRVIKESAKVQGQKSNGQPFYGPSGGIVWCSPNIDAKRGLVYIGTGENYTNPATTTSDAIQALDLKTGKLIWTYQATPHDTWNLGCPGKPNCPEKVGPDFDFGMAPILVKGMNGQKDRLVVGQKSSVVHALDPSTGKLLWQTRLGKGSALGGVHWGMATDGRYVYAANADNKHAMFPYENEDTTLKANPGLFALDLQNGKMIWKQSTPDCSHIPNCMTANSAAPLVLPGLVFAGTLDGHMRAYDTKDGKVLWDFDTLKEFPTLNGIPGKGGSIDGPSPVAVGNRLFVNSGYQFFGGIPGNVLIAFELEE
ncbi:MAG: PQQ-binding-like beta-propeller repeat protein [Haliscomenobacter sp.]|uniref:outer membrane protein assembly factor BamB family protein n=1 Tax=Haliscomenobacter sp. TaxID=2717303 RepID=UPI0029AAD595|nr:PQQ-binding-like beta-propeller repeat protein [Haliscomenobacter sp.]MDX2066972.1 PQQ-binding-like beta-propeller repeat protein [Haliscomenobacter sp.]